MESFQSSWLAWPLETGNQGAERQRAAKKFIKKQLETKKMYFWTPLDDLYV